MSVLYIHATALLIFLALSAGVIYYDVRSNPPSPNDAETTLEKVVDGFLKVIISSFVGVGITGIAVFGATYLFIGPEPHPYQDPPLGSIFIILFVIAPITFFISLIASLAILWTRKVNYLDSLATILISWAVMVFVLGRILGDGLVYIFNFSFGYIYLYYFALMFVLVVRWIYIRRSSISTSF